MFGEKWGKWVGEDGGVGWRLEVKSRGRMSHGRKSALNGLISNSFIILNIVYYY